MSQVPGVESGGAASSSGLQPAWPAVCDGEVGDAGGGTGAHVGQHGQLAERPGPQRLTEDKQKIILEGATVTYEKNGQRGQPRSYERLRTKMPAASKVRGATLFFRQACCTERSSRRPGAIRLHRAVASSGQ